MSTLLRWVYMVEARTSAGDDDKHIHYTHHCTNMMSTLFN